MKRHFKITGWLALSYALMGTLSLPLPLSAEVYIGGGVDVQHEDNIGRAEFDIDRLSDTITTTNITANYFQQLGLTSGLTLKAFAEYADHQHYDRLDHYNLGVAANFRLKPDLSFTAPWYSLTAKLTHAEYPDSDIRSGNILDFEGMIGQRFTDRILGKIGMGYNRHFAEDNNLPGGNNPDDVFNYDNTRLFAGLDYRYKKITLYGQYTYQVGSVVSTATPTANIINNADAIVLDEDIGPSGTTLAGVTPGPIPNNRFAYKLDADTQIGDIGINFAINRSLALDAMVRYVDVAARGDNNYDNYSAHLGLIFCWK
jgi:hypothetical protein